MKKHEHTVLTSTGNECIICGEKLNEKELKLINERAIKLNLERKQRKNKTK